MGCDEAQSIGALALRLMAEMARQYGWRPDEFWTATPAEVGAILAPYGADAGADGARGAAGFDRKRLRAMMEAIPDG